MHNIVGRVWGDMQNPLHILHCANHTTNRQTQDDDPISPHTLISII